MSVPTGSDLPALPPALTRLVAGARSDATRSGHGELTPWHLVLAIAMQRPELVDGALGRPLLSEATLRLSSLPRTFTEPIATPGCVEALVSAAPASDPVAALATVLRSVSGAPTTAAGPVRAPAAAGRGAPAPSAGPASAAPAGLRLTAVTEQYAEVETPPGWLIPRAEVTDGVLAALASGRSPLLVGAEGSGRTTSSALLAARLTDPGYDGPLRGGAVVRVRTADAVAVETGPLLQRLLQEVAGRAVVVLDDLEVLSGLGGGSRLDAGLLAVVRSAVHESGHRLVLLLAARYENTFAAQEPELVEECVRVELTPMTAAQVAAVAARRADELASAAAVSIPAESLAAAVEPPVPGDTDVHPGLAVRRLERAAAVAALRPERAVRPEDVVPPTQRPRFDPVAFRAALAAAIVGQDAVLDAVTRRLSVTRPELDLRPHRPDGVFLFAGPTGTGKTSLAEAMSQALDGSRDALVRLDMSEFSEPHTVAKLVGSPPGYVGSTDPSSWLTTKILARPECVLLLDEIEKADPVVWNTFLQVFDAGRLSDGLGRTADFARVVVVMTTNIGAGLFEGRRESTDPAADAAAVLAAVKGRMAPELVNRLDEVLVFAPLTIAAVGVIARRLVDDIVARTATRGYRLSYNAGVIDVLVAAGYEPAYGARPLQRAIERLLVAPLAACPPGRWHAAPDGAGIRWTAVAS